MKRLLLLSLGLLLLCFPLVGCDSEESLAAEEIAEIVEGVGTSEMDTCTFDIDMSATAKINANGQSIQASIDGGGEGAIDIVNEEMFLLLNMNAEIPFQDTQEMSLEMYVVDGWTYLNEDGEWTKEELSLEMLGEQDPSILIGQLVDLLALAEIEHNGSETINGVDCYKFQVTPDLGEMAGYAIEEFQQPGMDDFELDIPEELEEIMSALDVECAFWIAKEDNLLMKIQLDLGGQITSQDIPEMEMVGFDSISLDLNLEIVFDYNKDVTIVLPDEALNAYYQGDYEW